MVDPNTGLFAEVKLVSNINKYLFVENPVDLEPGGPDPVAVEPLVHLTRVIRFLVNNNSVKTGIWDIHQLSLQFKYTLC